jgi:hypothetical protein
MRGAAPRTMKLVPGLDLRLQTRRAMVNPSPNEAPATYTEHPRRGAAVRFGSWLG